ncbi:hypothetical protein JI667_00340 [Bacillus sp. NTK074B]|uniref:hypothetical protein n=1 Tax=Bacillus sp. NTK074B TaxID=2802174 RepID=UPI001A8EFC8A|nr:hypothetical protein [Bacillus sp. NTK074B]
MEKLIKYTIALVTIFVFFPLASSATEGSKQVNQSSKQLIGSIPDAKVNLYASEKEGILTDFKLQIDKDTLFFPDWVNVSNPTYSPHLYFTDLNHDQNKELIVVLTTDYGSEVVIQKVHVFHKDNNRFTEKVVEDPIKVINKNVTTTLSKNEAIIDVQNKKIKVNIDKYGIKPSHLFSNIAFGSVIKYKVINDKLVAIVGATISPSGGYIGEIFITYTLNKNLYQAKEIKFEPIN